MSSPQGQILSGSTSWKSMQRPSVEPAKPASLDPKDPLIGKQVYTRWSPGGPYIEGHITEYDPAKDMYKAVYGANTLNEFCDWIDMKEILPEHVERERNDHIIPSTVEQNDNAGA